MGEKALVKSLIKGFILLETVAEHQPSAGVRLTELSKHLGWNITTTYRLLTTLQECGYIKRDPVTGRYQLGVKVLELSAAFLRGLDLRSQASPFLNEVMSKTGLTALLVIFEEETGDVVYVDIVHSTLPVRIYAYVGIRFPANCTASGKALLAYLSEEQLERFIAKGLRKRTSYSISSPAELHSELVRVRESGYSTDKGENVETIHCVGAPIFNHKGKIVASVALTGSATQLPVEHFPELGAAVKECAANISKTLGYKGETWS